MGQTGNGKLSGSCFHLATGEAVDRSIGGESSMPSYMSYGLDASGECCPKTIPIGVRSTESFGNGGTTEHGKRSTTRCERKCENRVERNRLPPLRSSTASRFAPPRVAQNVVMMRGKRSPAENDIWPLILWG